MKGASGVLHTTAVRQREVSPSAVADVVCTSRRLRVPQEVRCDYPIGEDEDDDDDDGTTTRVSLSVAQSADLSSPTPLPPGAQLPPGMHDTDAPKGNMAGVGSSVDGAAASLPDAQRLAIDEAVAHALAERQAAVDQELREVRELHASLAQEEARARVWRDAMEELWRQALAAKRVRGAPLPPRSLPFTLKGL